MPDQNDQFAAEQFYDKLHAQEVTPQEEPEEPQFCLSAQWMKIVSEFLKAEKEGVMPDKPLNMALMVAECSDKLIQTAAVHDGTLYSDIQCKNELYKTAAACLRMLKELNKTD